MRTLLLAVGSLWLVLGASGVAQRAAATAAVPPVTARATAGADRLTLTIGPLERMYTPAQVRRLHPREGEVMLRGTMAMGGMGMPTPNRHLELHVLDRRTGRVVADATVSITYQRVGAMGTMTMGNTPTRVPVAVMEGVGAGLADLHYGNNVAMPPGAYRVVARVDGAAATYRVRVR